MMMMQDLIDRLNESVKPLITTVTNYFVEGKAMENDDQAAAVLSLQIALKNWEKIERECLALLDTE